MNSLLLWGCNAMRDHQPPFQKVDQKDIKKLSLPPMTPAIVSPPLPSPPFIKGRPVTIQLTPDSDLKPMLQQMALLGHVTLCIHDNCLIKKEGIFYECQKKDVFKALDDIASILDLRFEIDSKKVAHFYPNVPYSKTYQVQFLNLTRSHESHTGVASDIFSEKLSKNSHDNGSKNQLKSQTTCDFWKELEDNLHAILGDNEHFSVHKTAGVISIFANKQTHEQVGHYIHILHQISSTQVLIEAKIVEVTLLDQFKSGINWQIFTSNSKAFFTGNFGTMSQNNMPFPTGQVGEMITLGSKFKDFSAILSMLESFGNVRTLSSPRLTVLNNQTALLKVAQNEVYFKLNYDKYFSQMGAENFTVSSDAQTVPIGLVLSVQPSINLDSGEVMLFLRPTLSRLSKTVADPAVEIALSQSKNASPNTTYPSLVPIVEVREIESILRLKNNEMAIVGGLMEIRSVENNNGIPGLSQLPVIKDLTSSQSCVDQVTELVILITVHVIPPDYSAHPDQADYRLLQNYVNDPRSKTLS
jgi:MSHA type pilus biogenesis protein MshL